MSIFTALPMFHRNIISRILIPTAFIVEIVSKSGLPIGIGISLPSKISHTYIITLSPQQTVWCLLPFGWVLQGQKIKPGHLNLFIHVYNDFPNHEIQYGTKTLWVWSFHATIICWTSNNLSRKGGGIGSEIYSRADTFKTTSRHKLFDTSWAPTNIYIRVSLKKRLFHARVCCYQNPSTNKPE